MTEARTDRRSQLVQAAVDLVHRQGFSATTLADLAAEVGMPLGNVYYYFKTKDAIGQAIVEHRARGFEARLRAWDEEPDPLRRLEAFVDMTVDNRDALARSGCPIGTLCTELHKDRGALAEQAAGLFATSLAWLETQFRELGHGKESAKLAAHVLVVLEGASVLTHSFGDTSYVIDEANRLRQWLRNLPMKPGRAARRKRGNS
jgi:TetR/AcrR family transcriptional regulator, transcriptional repressor for nem operon